jgi:uncharacterized protein
VRPERGLLYLDSSALVKLVVEEPESRALAEFVDDAGDAVSSVVAAIEVPRAARRTGVAEVQARAERVVARLGLLELDEDVVKRSATLDPPGLRTLDAIHLASALSISTGLDAFVAYDERLLSAASASGLNVASPC